MTKEGQEFKQTEVNKLHHVIYTLDYYAERILRTQLNIGYRDFLLLMILDHNEPCTQQDIAQYMDVTKASISKRVHTLQNKELILRRPNPNNRRQNIIRLSGRGVMVLIKAYRLLTEASEPLFTVLGERRKSFKDHVDTLYKGVDQVDYNN